MMKINSVSELLIAQIRDQVSFLLTFWHTVSGTCVMLKLRVWNTSQITYCWDKRKKSRPVVKLSCRIWS